MKTFYVNDRRRTQIRSLLAFKGEAQTIKYDFGPWAEDNGTVTDVTITVKSGQAAISGESLTSNVKTFIVTTSEVGGSMLKLVATAGSNLFVTHLDVFSKDPDRIVSDYGLVNV